MTMQMKMNKEEKEKDEDEGEEGDKNEKEGICNIGNELLSCEVDMQNYLTTTVR